MTHVTCRLTAKNRDQLRNPTLGNRVRATFLNYRAAEGEVMKWRGVYARVWLSQTASSTASGRRSTRRARRAGPTT